MGGVPPESAAATCKPELPQKSARAVRGSKLWSIEAGVRTRREKPYDAMVEPLPAEAHTEKIAMALGGACMTAEARWWRSASINGSIMAGFVSISKSFKLFFIVVTIHCCCDDFRVNLSLRVEL